MRPAPAAYQDRGGITLLEVDRLSKAFGPTRALTAASLRCEPGMVHTILGENGSGKSTLVKCLAGVIPPDGGVIRIDGAAVRPSSPAFAHRLGIATVFQEILIVPERSVLENVLLGYDGLFGRRVSGPARMALASGALKRLTNRPLDLNASVGQLDLATQQLIVIARALVLDPTILVLDEASSALDIDDRAALFAAIHSIVADGRIVLFISHRMEEVLELSDRVTVLRNGESVATVERGAVDAEGLLALMSPNVS